MNRRPAFTLIELLVVIAIIALLISILVPSLSKAKELAVRLSCSVNLRNMQQATHIYTNQSNEMFPWQRRTGGGGGTWKPEQVYWATSLVDIIGKKNVNRVAQILQCPAHTESTTRYGQSYHYNFKLGECDGDDHPFKYVGYKTDGSKVGGGKKLKAASLAEMALFFDGEQNRPGSTPWSVLEGAVGVGWSGLIEGSSRSRGGFPRHDFGKGINFVTWSGNSVFMRTKPEWVWDNFQAYQWRKLGLKWVEQEL